MYGLYHIRNNSRVVISRW